MKHTLKNREPVYVVTDDKWSQDAYVVFADEKIIGGAIPAEWVDERLSHEQETAIRYGDETKITIEDIETIMSDEFRTDNSIVVDFWPEHSMLLTDNNEYYKYTDDGMVQFIGEFDSVDEATQA